MSGSRGRVAGPWHGNRPGFGASGALGVAAATALSAPVVLGAGYAFLASLGLVGPGASGLSLERFRRVLADPAVWEGALWTVWVGLASTVLAAGAAVLVAVAFRSRGASSALAHGLAVLPLPIPHLVAGVLGVLVLGQTGILPRFARAAGLLGAGAEMPPLVHDGWGVGLILSLAWKEFAFLFLLASSLLAERGGELEEVARGLGAGRWATFRRVTAPVLGRGLLPGVVAVFTFVTGSYEVAALLAPSNPLALPLLTRERYLDAALDRRGDAFVLALLAFAIAAAAVAVHERIRARWRALGT
jgi:putative spermidine/putrescine transport system permease protein